MTAPFDIFQAETAGGVMWLASATTLEEAKARAEEFALKAPGDYLLLNQKTGVKLVINLSRSEESPVAI